MKSTDFETKTAGVAVVAPGAAGQGDGYQLKGYLTLFNVPDLVGDVTAPGSFVDTIKENTNPPLLWQHNVDMPPIGKIKAWSETSEGVFFIADLAKGVQLAEDVRILTKMGALSGVSYGYNTEKSSPTYQAGKRLRRLEKVKVLEVSIVNFPAHPQARLVGSEGKDLLVIGEVETLRSCGLPVSRKQLLDYMNALERQTDRILYGKTREEVERDRVLMLKLIDAELDKIKTLRA